MKFYRQTLLLSLFAIACLNTAWGVDKNGAETNREWTVSDRLTVRNIHPGIWVHTSSRTLKSGTTFPANGLIIQNDQELILADTAWGADITEELLDWIDAELGLPVSTVIVGHFHSDSMGGSPVLAKRGIPFVGNPVTRMLGTDEGVPLPEAIAGLELGSSAAIGNVEVFYPGAGHSADGLFVWVPEAGVLFGGCAVRSPAFPGLGNTADADLASWPGAILRVQEEYPQVRLVVPGHGPVGDASLLSHTIALFNADEP